jgi:epoxyqueuosine reductase
MNALLEQVTTYCHSFGFSLVGFTTPADMQFFPVYQKWIADGCQAGMQYLAGERALFQRRSPRNVMPNCQSILVLAYPYLTKIFSDQEAEEHFPSVAAYACLEDYHLFLPPLLEKIVQFIQSQVAYPLQSRILTDSGPLLERELAYRAGLGWIGKNSCLINQEHGSFFFLAEILLDMPLDEPESNPAHPSDRCGTCQRCIDVCPTQCIRNDRTLDARKCISYLTIENKGEIPLSLRPMIGEHLFGCDLCQQVCPWNRKALAASKKIAYLQFLLEYFYKPQPSRILNEMEFNQKFHSSPILRAKRRGLYRNLAVVLGNRKDPRYVPTLLALLNDTDALVRQHAAWGLGCFLSDIVRFRLQEALQVEKDETVLLEIKRVLTK